jgi:mRNA interferase HigB
MRIIALSTLKAFWSRNPGYRDAEQPVLAWYKQALAADWSQPSDIKTDFASASILQDGRVVFNIAGNKYRLVVWINYDYRIVYVRFIRTHKQYDKIDVQKI